MGTLFSRDRWRAIHYLSPTKIRIWLAEVISENVDQIVHDLLTAEGLWTDRPEELLHRHLR